MRPNFCNANGCRLTLVVITVIDVLVVVDRARLALVEPCQLGRLEVADVEDVGDGQLAGRRSLCPVTLVELVVEDEEFLVGYVEDGALVDVLGAGV